MRDRKILCALPAALILSAGCEYTKTDSPLSPLVAGPMRGVDISQAKGLEPGANWRIEDKNQPITLLVENPSSNSPRPFTLTVQVASDQAFQTVVHEKSGLTPGPNGRTSYTLPERLPYGRSYYWRSRALDGANSGDWSAVVRFEILEPIVIGTPIPASPRANERVTTRTPTLSATNGVSSGPHGALFFLFQMSTAQSFASLIVNQETMQNPSGVTTYSVPVTLSYDTTYYWRVRTTDGLNVGNWSVTETFRTPLAPVVVPPPPGPTPGGSCVLSTGGQIVDCNRARYPGQMSSSQIVSFLIQTAKDLNAAGINGAPFGILVKTDGHQCNGYSCDIVCSGNGSGQRQWDVLSDADGAQLPVFGEITGPKIVRPCVIQ